MKSIQKTCDSLNEFYDKFKYKKVLIVSEETGAQVFPKCQLIEFTVSKRTDKINVKVINGYHKEIYDDKTYQKEINKKHFIKHFIEWHEDFKILRTI